MKIDVSTLTEENPQLVSRNLIPFLLNNCGLTGTGVEIGTQCGHYSERLLHSSKLTRLFSVDPWLNQPNEKYSDNANVDQELQDYRYLQTVMRLNQFGGRSTVLRMYSHEAVEHFRDGSLDFVYIDGDHSFEACAQDLEMWWPKLKVGGLFAGHDYLDGMVGSAMFGVKSAVDQFARNQSINVLVTNAVTDWEIAWPSWYFFKR